MSRTNLLRRLLGLHVHHYTLVYGLRGWVAVCKCGHRIVYGKG